MTDLEICFARLSECRSEAAIEAVLDAAWEKIMQKHGHSMEAAKLNTQVLYMGRERRLTLKAR